MRLDKTQTYIAFKGMKEVVLRIIFEVIIQLMLPKNAFTALQVDHLEMMCAI